MGGEEGWERWDVRSSEGWAEVGLWGPGTEARVLHVP